jgi:hypothetical protein
MDRRRGAGRELLVHDGPRKGRQRLALARPRRVRAGSADERRELRVRGGDDSGRRIEGHDP